MTALIAPNELRPIELPLVDEDDTIPAAPPSLDHQRELAEANKRARKVLRAAKVAAFNGWSLGICAALSAPFALFSLKALVMCLGLALVAWNEFHGQKLLKRFDQSGPRFLGWNQLGLLSLLIIYSVCNIYFAFNGPNPYAEQIQATPELASMLGSVGELYATVTLFVYGSLIIGSLIFQGLNAVYYFSRQKHLQAYLDQTPAWVVDLQRSMSAA